MAEQINTLIEQLKQTCKLSGARWVVWLRHTNHEWDFMLQHALTRPRQAALAELIAQSDAAAWLAGSFSSGRTRSRNCGEYSDALGCERMFVFANPKFQSAILVGADQLSKEAQGFYRVLALQNPEPAQEIPTFDPLLTIPFEMGPEVAYDPQTVFTWVLTMASGMVPGKAAYLAMRVGDFFQVETVSHYPEAVRGQAISISRDPVLTQMLDSHKGVILPVWEDAPSFVLAAALPRAPRSGMAVPIRVGKRIIGVLVFVAYQESTFSQVDLTRCSAYLDRVAHSIENTLVFAEISRYLQQFVLLNELAAAVAIGTDTDEVTHRVVRRLRRVFHTEKVAILLLAPGERWLREYGFSESNPQLVPIEGNLAGYVIETGQPLRLGDPPQAPLALNRQPNTSSALVVPLKYRGKVIGAITVESPGANIFTSQDEQLLVVVASHLAGLLENVQLHQEARERARNLNLIHKVVQEVVGLTDDAQIAQVAAGLMGEYFGYEFAVIMLADDASRELVIQGVGGTHANMLSCGERFPIERGLTGRVIRNGRSYYSNNIADEPDYYSKPEWQAGSEMIVPLCDDNRVFGLINLERLRTNAFSDTDQVLMESLAGILSSMMMKARRYRELQVKVGHLQAVRQTALDISGDLDLDVLLKRVTLRALELAQAKGAILGLVDKDSQTVQNLIFELPWPGRRFNSVALGAGVMGRVAATGEPLNVADYNNWPGRLDSEEPFPMTAVAAVPLKWKGEVLGALMVMDDQPGREFQDEERQLLELLAPQVAVSVRNARLYQELGERIAAQELAERRMLHSARLAALGEMAAGVAHELNNPLTTVSGFVELALEELPEDLPQRSELALVLNEARRAREVVRRLLDFARQSEKLRVVCDLNDLAGEVLSLIQHQVQISGIQIQVNLGRSLPPITVDPNQVKQVLLNLIQNACQAMPEGGELAVRTAADTRHEQNWLTIAVRDSGEGIPAQILDRIFEPFFTTRPLGKGTGLGLSVSYGLIADHGGFIDVQSEPGKGSCFTIWLPLENELSHG